MRVGVNKVDEVDQVDGVDGMRGARRAGFVLALAALAAVGCSGPRTLMLDETNYRRRPSNYWIDVWDAPALQPHREIAVIESSPRASDDDASLWEMVEELKAKARRLGGDAVQDIRLLQKEVRGLTIDERTPFPSWKQGRYPLHFLRGTAIVYESSLPGAVGNAVGFKLLEDERAGRGERPPPL